MEDQFFCQHGGDVDRCIVCNPETGDPNEWNETHYNMPLEDLFIPKEETYQVELSESEMWAVVTALMEYSEEPMSDEHGVLALQVYERIKKLVLE